MGMAASQARLLSITARLSDNEQSGQQLSYAKERLADRTDQATKEYNEALKATKLQVMTGYADGAASYSDISFSTLISPQVVSSLGKQYCVTDTKGRVLVDATTAQAFINAKGSLNAFLGALSVDCMNGNGSVPLSVSDVDPTKKANGTKDLAIEEKIHEAWDKYFNSIGKEFSTTTTVTNEDGSTTITETESHDWTFAYVDTDNDKDGKSEIGEGYATIFVTGFMAEGDDPMVLNYEGTCQEQLDLYNYAMAITESYYSASHKFTEVSETGTLITHVSTNYDQGNSAMINYYTNLYNKMLTSGFYSYTNTLSNAQADPEHWLYDNDLYKGASSADTDGTPLKDPNTFEEYLKEGKLLIQTFSKSEGKFVSTSISEDTCIQEVEDETKIAIAEAKYEDDLTQIQRLDSRYDLQMKQLDTEHNTLQTEYESVKKVISKNVEKSFSTFG